MNIINLPPPVHVFANNERISVTEIAMELEQNQNVAQKQMKAIIIVLNVLHYI